MVNELKNKNTTFNISKKYQPTVHSEHTPHITHQRFISKKYQTLRFKLNELFFIEIGKVKYRCFIGIGTRASSGIPVFRLCIPRYSQRVVGLNDCLSPTSKYRWRIVNHHTTVCDLDDGVGKRAEWRLNGTLHREQDKPARVYACGNKVWYFNDKLHREDDKPAYIGWNGSKVWWFHGKLHREDDKPARVYASGSKQWWFNGKRHREHNQPAQVWADGTREWWVNGKKIK